MSFWSIACRWVAAAIVVVAPAVALGAPVVEAEQKAVKVPTLNMEVRLPDSSKLAPTDDTQWRYVLGDATQQVKLSARRAAGYTDVVFLATDFQPDPEALQVGIAPWLERWATGRDIQFTAGEASVLQVENLGPVTILPADGMDPLLERPLWSILAVFPVESAGAMLLATSSESAERVRLELDDMLRRITVTNPAVPLDQLPTGRLEVDAGYDLVLPDGWRALTEAEARLLSTERIAGDGPFEGRLANLYGVDMSTLDGLVFTCKALSGMPLEVLPPGRAPEAAENFRKFAKVNLRGGTYRVALGAQDVTVEVLTPTPLYPTTEGDVEYVELGDRGGYLWHVEGTLFQQPAVGSIFYTAWDDVGLTCQAVATPDQMVNIEKFDAMVRALRVREGDAHPMLLSVRARYRMWWPYSHPALQLYWLPIPILLVASWLVLKD